jgi:aminoglycoside/choline kinase family phosphotransferase
MLAASQFGLRQNQMDQIHLETLAGDGSDRGWIRAAHGQTSYVICNHGICTPGSDALGQLNAFVRIGHHLLKKKIPVPRILNHDTLSGMVLLEDLGDTHLQTQVQLEKDPTQLFCLYQQVIDHLVLFSTRGAEGFDTQWTCQTSTYSKELILEKECRYFVEAFLQDHQKLSVSFEDFSDEFAHIADHALKHGVMGLMHRDMQSRNIMLKNSAVFFIDFQSARIGPLQYDLASLLIDPYISLNATLQKDLLCYTMDLLDLSPNERAAFSESYHYCCLTRNLQFLGAFSFLSGVKKKKIFEQYIPVAVNSLKVIMQAVDTVKLAKLFKLIQTL